MTSVMSASDVRNKIGELWNLADKEPVTIECNGTARYVVASIENFAVIPRAEYERLRAAKKPPQAGFASDLFAGLDTYALLGVDVNDEFKDYL